MLRRWCISLATLGLAAGAAVAAPAAGGALAAPHPATVTATRVITHGSIRNGGVAVHLSRPGAPLSAQSGIRRESTTSTNWSGYAADGGTYTSVSAKWKEPTGSCSGSGTKYSSFWVGLDGYSSQSVEQTGTDTDCSGGRPQYYGWYEMYPNPSYSFGHSISAGDTINASVVYQGSNSYKLTLSDTTKGWSVNTTKTLSGAPRSSAEVIIEAPCCTNSGGPLPLADFGTVNFSNSLVNGSAIGNSSPVEITMVDSSGQDKDTVSSLSGGENFSATWKRAN
ncbi:MAG TPA: G1 family glutamic endopeptidase [Trebonia sp.]|nr:G1 family glutamic endopeptidase [Trebonia sp.]